jgi:hypothetical protein
VYYVEAHTRTPTMLLDADDHDGSRRAADFIAAVCTRFDFHDRWAYHALHADGKLYGMSDTALRDVYASADLLINLHGGTQPLDEHLAGNRLIFVETDPVLTQIELHNNTKETIDLLAPHRTFFTFGEDYGRASCGLPIDRRFHFRATRQPVVIDLWEPHRRGAGAVFTTIGNWRQTFRDITFEGKTYSWSKHEQFRRFMDLPKKTNSPFELALSTYAEEDRRLLESHGWAVRYAAPLSKDVDAYRRFVAGSRGEFTVAKEQNVHFQTGWFSDRSATYLASGRPVVTQDTGFGEHLPVGAGLFSFRTLDDAAAAIEIINADYDRHSRAAIDIARQCFAHDVVLPKLLEEAGVS